jgi:molybdenum cofactor cytidylyltransferase
MGTQKLLLPYASQSVIGHVVDEVLAASIEQTIVVTAHEDESIRLALAGRRLTFVANPDLAGDMLSSVRCGLRALPAGCEAVLVVLGDQPSIRSQLVADLTQAFQTTGAKIVVPVFAGRRGHPFLFSADYFDEILTQHDGCGLRGLLQAHSSEITLLAVTDAAVLADMDTPDDYQSELSRLP